MGIVRRLRLELRRIEQVRRPIERLEENLRALKARARHKRPRAPDGFGLVRGGTVTIEAPDYLGTFSMDAQSHLFRRIVQTGEFEPACAAAVKRVLSRNRDALDIGANVGFFSVLFGKLLEENRRVLAVEPIPTAIQHLRTNLVANQLETKVEVYEGAAGERDSRQSMELIFGREEYSAPHVVHPSVAHDQRRTVEVNTTTVDKLVEASRLEPGFIKLDIEGSEVSALRGAAGTLSRFRPHILVEYVPNLLAAAGSSGEEMLSLLKQHDYAFQWLSESEILATPR